MFKINNQSPPSRGAIPKQTGYTFSLPQPVGIDGLGRPIVNDADVPWVQLAWERMDQASWNWYTGFMESHGMYAHLSSVTLLDPFTYLVPGGPQWVTFTGPNIYMNRPSYDTIDSGFYFGVVIDIRGLE